ncbi:MAG TPA: F0F1 ATP synthase subunit delta [bacterium]|nr:F0F1 ATP synthase subunit delta [bacterium]
MKIKLREYAQLLYALLMEEKNKSRKVDQLLYGFLCLVNSQGDLGKMENIINSFEAYYQEKEEVLAAKVVSARRLDEEMLKIIRKYLQQTKPEIRNWEVKEIIDPAVLGGVKIMTEDKFLDGTIQKQIINLKNSLIQ